MTSNITMVNNVSPNSQDPTSVRNVNGSGSGGGSSSGSVVMGKSGSSAGSETSETPPGNEPDDDVLKVYNQDDEEDEKVAEDILSEDKTDIVKEVISRKLNPILQNLILLKKL